MVRGHPFLVPDLMGMLMGIMMSLLSFLRLVAFTQQNAFVIHPNYCVIQQSVPLKNTE